MALRPVNEALRADTFQIATTAPGKRGPLSGGAEDWYSCAERPSARISVTTAASSSMLAISTGLWSLNGEVRGVSSMRIGINWPCAPDCAAADSAIQAALAPKERT